MCANRVRCAVLTRVFTTDPTYAAILKEIVDIDRLVGARPPAAPVAVPITSLARSKRFATAMSTKSTGRPGRSGRGALITCMHRTAELLELLQREDA